MNTHRHQSIWTIFWRVYQQVRFAKLVATSFELPSSYSKMYCKRTEMLFINPKRTPCPEIVKEMCDLYKWKSLCVARLYMYIYTFYDAWYKCRYANIWCMIWYDMIWYDMIWYDMMTWHEMIWYMLWCIIWYMLCYALLCYCVIYDMLWYDTKQCHVIWFNVMQCSAMYYDIISCHVIYYQST